MRKRHKQLKEYFATIFNDLSEEQKVELASTLMLKAHLHDPYSILSVLMDLEVARMATEIKQINAENQRIRGILEEFYK